MRRACRTLAALLAAVGLACTAAPAQAASLTVDRYVALYNTQQECRHYTGCDTARAYVNYGGGRAGCSTWFGYFPTRYYGWREIVLYGIGGC